MFLGFQNRYLKTMDHNNENNRLYNNRSPHCGVKDCNDSWGQQRDTAHTNCIKILKGA